jgi:hypothetical protein
LPQELKVLLTDLVDETGVLGVRFLQLLDLSRPLEQFLIQILDDCHIPTAYLVLQVLRADHAPFAGLGFGQSLEFLGLLSQGFV